MALRESRIINDGTEGIRHFSMAYKGCVVFYSGIEGIYSIGGGSVLVPAV